MEFLAEYGLFLAKAITVVIAVAVILGLIVSAAASKQRKPLGGVAKSGDVEIVSLNKKLKQIKENLLSELMDDGDYKAYKKSQNKQDKEHKKLQKKASKQKEAEDEKRRIFVLNFDGDVSASQVEGLREEISAVLLVAKTTDEVVVNVESPGGMVHTYGLAASQLARIKAKNIPLTVCVDKVAASGGYLMACQADKILAAPFAIIGSIGVLAQVPNANRLLKRFDIDYEILTAGEHKQSMTVWGENTDKMREKMKEDLEGTHELFKGVITQNRPTVDINKVATGEIWYGQQAINKQLIDDIQTSDDYLLNASETANIYQVSYEEKRSIQDKIGDMMHLSLDKTLNKLLSRLSLQSMQKY